MSDPPVNAGALSSERRDLLDLRLREKGIRLRRSRPIGPRRGSGACPLSFAQQRLWFLDQLGAGAAYNVPLAVRLTGCLNVPALGASLGEIVRRHEALRTSFTVVEGNPVQVIAPGAEASLPLVDLTGLSQAQREVEARRLAAAEAERPFDLARASLFRATLLRLLGEDHLLLLTMHHIVSDGWSMGVFARELAALYAAFCREEPSPLPELPIQYADFAVWQREWLRGEVLEEQLSYWRRQLDGVSVLQLPTDRPRPGMQTFRGALEPVAFPRVLTEGLGALSRREGVTLFMTLLAAFQALLSRHTGQEDIVVGSPIANRNRKEIEGLIGFFVNSLALRSDLSGDPSFRDLLGRVREVALEAYAHQDLPFEKLVEELHPERDSSRTPLFQIMFSVENEAAESLKLPGLKLTLLEPDTVTARFDLEFHLRKSPTGLGGLVVYNTDLFDGTTITRMLDHYRVLLEGIVADPDQRISDLPLLAQSERRELLVNWNDTPMDYRRDACVPGLFEARAEQAPEAVAVVSGARQLSYQELNARSNQLAHYLQRKEVGPEVRVGVCLQHSVDLVVALLGILKAGGAYVPLDPEYPTERLAFMLEDSRVRILVTQDGLASGFGDQGLEVVRLDLDRDVISRESEETPLIRTTGTNLAYVIYTSGSTGTPKGVAIPHRGLLNLVSWHQDRFEVMAADRASQLAAMAFDASTWEIWPYLAAGASVHLAPPEALASPGHLRDWLVSRGITISFVPTPLAEHLLSLDWPSEISLRILLTGGDTLHHPPPGPLPFTVVNNYGPTEATVVTTSGSVRPGRGLNVRPPIGRPIANTQVHLLDRCLSLVPVGVTGELFIGGVGLARGYLRKPALTAERFLPDPFGEAPGARLYRTGDLARRLPDGEIEFIGRVDQQVKLRGFRIELGEIEVALGQLAFVTEAVAVVREDVPGNRRLVAYVVSRRRPPPSAGEIRDELKQKLPAYMVPSALVFLDVLPVTSSGKVDRAALPPPEGPRAGTEEGFVPPRTSAEKIVARIWGEVLGVEKVGIHDNFFDLGGHSLLFMQVVYRLEEELGVRLNPRTAMFQNLQQIAKTCEGVQDQREPAGPGDRTAAIAGVEPFYFGRSGKELFGCHHSVPGGCHRDCGMVLLYPMGEEYIRFHRAYRQLADRLCSSGFSVLRFDFFGCGDSRGACEEGGIREWLMDASTAIDESRRRSGARKVCLVGLRLGGTLAMMAAATRGDVESIVLLDPVISGRRYLEELMAWHGKMLRYSHVKQGRRKRGEPPGEILGFPMTASMLADLEGIDLLSIRQKPASQMLVVESHEEERSRPLAAHLGGLGLDLTYQHRPDPELWKRSDRFLIEDVNRVQIPHAILLSVVSWASKRFS